MIYVTMTTRNRFWHAALTALSIAQAHWENCFIHVLDDASDDQFAEAKTFLFEELRHNGIIHRYERLPKRVGFCEGRKILVDRFLSVQELTDWFHFDDDILIGEQTQRLVYSDLTRKLKSQGILHVYVNPWCNHHESETNPPGFETVTKIGGACYIIPKPLIEATGNPYAGQTDGEQANAAWWLALQRAGFPMYVRTIAPHQCQHTGNVDSTIFGSTPKWEKFYAKNFKTGELIEVPPFRMSELRPAVRKGSLSSYVYKMNAACRVKIKLPAQGSV